MGIEKVVCGVMKSLEEEIRSSNRGKEIQSYDFYDMDEMSYLIKPSNDEIRIPPRSSMYEGVYVDVVESQKVRDSGHACNVEGLWQLEDQLAT